ncbi:hypothetical protein L218DRAFT_946495 [Marasmius fiardii PR-910]|nr:hypothetical protein L218DRAFT_946495 [Marasmius fiardii PR-910]
MAALLDIHYPNYTLTLWRWAPGTSTIPILLPSTSSTSINTFMSGSTLTPDPYPRPSRHQVAIIAKPKINDRGSNDSFPSSGMIVSTAYLGPRKVANTDPGIPVVLKFAIGEANIAILQREAMFYENELRRLQGSVVPKCFGLYRGMQDRYHSYAFGGGRALGGPNDPMACLVLEYCSGYGDHAMTANEYNHRLKLAVLALHQAGVGHGKLSDSRNIIDCGSQKGIRIVDFSSAYLHECPNAHGGLLPHSRNYVHRYPSGGCRELEGFVPTKRR